MTRGGNQFLKMHPKGDGTNLYKVVNNNVNTVNRPAVGFDGTLFFATGTDGLMKI